MALDPDRSKAIDTAIASIEKMFGKGAIMKYGAADVPKIEAIPTGSLHLNKALGIGGVPKGRVVEIFGHESSGKTTIALHIIAESQKMGGVVAFIDAEHALDINYARKLGVNTDELLVSQPDHGEQALEIAETLVRSGAISVVVVDSVAALVPKSELEGDVGDVQPGAQARLMSQVLRRLTGAIHKSECIVIFINQTREKIGVMFGSPKTTSGGNALKFYASVRLEITRIGQVKKGEDIIGNRTKIKVVKNKVAPPFVEIEFDIYYGSGVCNAAELIDLGLESGDVVKSGSWFSVGDERVAQGRENLRDALLARPELMERLRKMVVGPKDGAEGEAPAEGAAPVEAAAPARRGRGGREAAQAK